MRTFLFVIVASLIPPAQSPPCERLNYERNICGPATNVGTVHRQLNFTYGDT